MHAEEMQELIATTSVRTKMYGLLARIYRQEADETLLEELRQGAQDDFEPDDRIGAGYRTMVQGLEIVDERLITALAVDYAKVFLGAAQTSGQAAYPYESVYTSKEHLLMQESRDEVVEAYRSQGYAIRQGSVEPEDHIGFELEFMSLLSAKTEKVLSADDLTQAERLLEAQLSFLREHLSKWAPLFAEHLKRYAVTDFYKGVAEVTAGFIAADLQLVSELIAEEELGAVAL